MEIWLNLRKVKKMYASIQGKRCNEKARESNSSEQRRDRLSWKLQIVPVDSVPSLTSAVHQRRKIPKTGRLQYKVIVKVIFPTLKFHLLFSFSLFFFLFPWSLFSFSIFFFFYRNIRERKKCNVSLLAGDVWASDDWTGYGESGFDEEAIRNAEQECVVLVFQKAGVSR